MNTLANSIVFETDRLIVRWFTLADKDNYFALNGNQEVMQYIRPVKTKEESDAFLQEIMAHYTTDTFTGRWAVDEKDTGKFAGSFVIIPIPDDIEKIQLGYSLLPEQWGKGFATELTKEGLNYFYNKTPLSEIYGVTETPNTASQKVLVKAGFQFLSKKMEGEKELLVFIVKRGNGCRTFI